MFDIPRRLRLPVILMLLASSVPAAWAGEIRRQRDTPPVSWNERDGAIDYGSVCKDYRRGSIRYRDCRAHAAEIFERRCRRYRTRASDLGRDAGAEIRRQKAKYCRAVRQYRPLR